jgi:hypothetical protein
MLDSAVDDSVESAGAAISGSALERDEDREVAISLLSFSLSDVAGVDRVIWTARVANCEELSSKSSFSNHPLNSRYWLVRKRPIKSK